MATKELRKRENWQTISGKKALKAEDLFYISMQRELDRLYPGVFTVDDKPTDFASIYSTFELSSDTLSQIYNVDVTERKPNGELKYKWGLQMDFAIRNTKNGKVLFGEIKRQDGWIETNEPSAGRGNAHERSCKYFTPGLMKVLREASGLSTEILPFWLVIIGDITRDPKRNREIAFWFQEYTKNFFMWRDTKNSKGLINFFVQNLLPYLL